MASNSMARARRFLPWLIAAFLIYFLFQRYPVNEVLAAASHVNATAFLGFILFYFIYIGLTDIWSLNLILNRFGIHSRFKNILELRLASYPPMILNYGVGQGVLAYMIKRKYEESFVKVSSVLLYILMIDLYWAFTFTFCGSFFYEPVLNGHDLVVWIRSAWLGVSVLLLALFVFWRLPLLEDKMKWLKAQNLFHTFHRAKSSDYFMVMLWRFPLHCATSTYLYFLALCFGVNISFVKVVTLLPLIEAVSAIPITPSGIGTSQIATVLLFQDHVSGGAVAEGQVSGAEIILAMSLLFTIAIYCLKLMSGSLFIQKITKP
jgi:uncharacterized membrane protein YbhN (UPF0104 family)